MLVDRYDPVDLFAYVPRLYRDFEPELKLLDGLLDDDVLFERVRADLAQRYPNTLRRGRPSTPVEVILRMLVVKRLYGWSYEETEHFVSDSLVLRQFCRIYFEGTPDDTTLIRWANTIGPGTLEELNRRVVELAHALKVTRGRKLRVDSTAVETDIAHPTDSRTLGDGVRVLSCLLRRAKKVLDGHAAVPKQLFRTRTRSVRRLAQRIHRLARRRGEEATQEMRSAYEQLIGVAEASARSAERARGLLEEQGGKKAERLLARLQHFLPLVRQGITQARRRVLQGESVPAQEKILSLFEPHTQIILRHKAGRAVEFGRKVLLDEADGGIVTRYSILPDPGPEQEHLAASVETHRRIFGRAPHLLATDRGLSSAKNEKMAEEAGVRRVVLPRTGKLSEKRRAHERQSWFRRGFRFRSGIEGRISVLRRRYGLGRCRYRGERGMGRWVGWGILAHNLAQIGRTVVAREARGRLQAT
jgi:IS5 family transposase